MLTVGILRRHMTRLANEKSFVPFAIELDVQRGTCSARFARKRGQSYEITRLLPLPNALVELASSGPIQLATDRTNRREQLRERSERFFHEAITDFLAPYNDAKIWLEPEIEVARSGRTLREHELNRALQVIGQNRDYLLEVWYGYKGRAR